MTYNVFGGTLPCSINQYLLTYHATFTGGNKLLSLHKHGPTEHTAVYS